MQRARARDREEFVGLIVSHATGPTGIGSQDEQERIRAAQRLLRYGATLGRLAEEQCNGYQTWDGHEDEKRARASERKEERITQAVTKVCESIGVTPIFGGDPRGNTLKIRVSDGYTNDWGREGICVPTS